MASLRIEPTTSYGEEGASLVINDEGALTISVAEEKAVGSYNETFECTLTLTVAQTILLRNWLCNYHLLKTEKETI